MQSSTRPRYLLLHCIAAAAITLLLTLFACPLRAQSTPTQALSVPLYSPAGLTYDTAGNLYFAESARHTIRMVSPAGLITTIAGTGTQGFAGDGGPATAALLDSPADVALDSSGHLFIADAGNHRIRRVDLQTGIIATYAGTGRAGSSLDGGLAISADLDLPAALAVDALGNVFFADSRANRVRRIDQATGRLTTVAGTGVQGFAGDQGPATQAQIDGPSGLAIDAAGNLFLSDTQNACVRRVEVSAGIISTVARGAAIRMPRGLAFDPGGTLFIADSLSHRVVRVDPTTHALTVVAGGLLQGFAGDAGPAASALLNSPDAVTVNSAGLPVLSDTANGRIRAIDATAKIYTIAGLGSGVPGVLVLTGPAVALYGTGVVMATLASSAASGSVTLFEDQSLTLAAQPLTANAAAFSTASLAAGSHHLSATYAGDALHSPAASATLALTIAPAPATAALASFTILYGQALPALTGSLLGILPQDTGNVQLSLLSSAAVLSSPGMYPVTASLTGTAAANYALTAPSASVTITKTPSAVSLSNGLAVHVAPATAGIATGSVALQDGSATYASARLSPTGDAAFSASNLTAGTHTLTAFYAGDGDLLPSSSSPLIITVGPVAGADFALISSGSGTVTIPAGNPAQFSFGITPINGALSSPIQLTASGLPSGATASFNPAYIVPSANPQAFILTVQTIKSASLAQPARPWIAFAIFIPCLLVIRRRPTRLLGALLAVLIIAGCGDRINTSAAISQASRSYNLTVIATATSTSGATLQHTAAVTLTLQ